MRSIQLSAISYQLLLWSQESGVRSQEGIKKEEARKKRKRRRKFFER
ncbi:hypothetical protein [Okeania sp. SIO2C2]|nr:hypothetical protein [Okeania sp. SIO2C2]